MSQPSPHASAKIESFALKSETHTPVRGAVAVLKNLAVWGRFASGQPGAGETAVLALVCRDLLEEDIPVGAPARPLLERYDRQARADAQMRWTAIERARETLTIVELRKTHPAFRWWWHLDVLGNVTGGTAANDAPRDHGVWSPEMLGLKVG